MINDRLRSICHEIEDADIYYRYDIRWGMSQLLFSTPPPKKITTLFNRIIQGVTDAVTQCCTSLKEHIDRISLLEKLGSDCQALKHNYMSIFRWATGYCFTSVRDEQVEVEETFVRVGAAIAQGIEATKQGFLWAVEVLKGKAEPDAVKNLNNGQLVLFFETACNSKEAKPWCETAWPELKDRIRAEQLTFGQIKRIQCAAAKVFHKNQLYCCLRSGENKWKIPNCHLLFLSPLELTSPIELAHYPQPVIDALLSCIAHGVMPALDKLSEDELGNLLELAEDLQLGRSLQKSILDAFNVKDRGYFLSFEEGGLALASCLPKAQFPPSLLRSVRSLHLGAELPIETLNAFKNADRLSWKAPRFWDAAPLFTLRTISYLQIDLSTCQQVTLPPSGCCYTENIDIVPSPQLPSGQYLLLLARFPKIKKIDLSKINDWWYLESVLKKCSRIEEIYIEGGEIIANTMALLLDRQDFLKKLTLKGMVHYRFCAPPGQPSFLKSLARLTTLKELTINSQPDMRSDLLLEQLGGALPAGLRQLTLERCLIDPEKLKKFIEAFPGIKLIFKDCPLPAAAVKKLLPEIRIFVQNHDIVINT